MVADVAVPAWGAWLAGVTAVCAALLALAGVWSKVVRPLLTFGATIETYFPAMIAIAKAYADERGGEALTAELTGLAVNQGSIAANQELLVAKLDAVTAKLDELHAYSHQMRHDIIGDVAALGMVVGTSSTIVDALVQTAEQLKAVRAALEHHDDVAGGAGREEARDE